MPSPHRVAQHWLRIFVARENTRAPSDPLFAKFLQERYQGGNTSVPNPNPDMDVRRRTPRVRFQTALKDDHFRRQVSREFEAWKARQNDEGTRKEVQAPPEHSPKTRREPVPEEPGTRKEPVPEDLGTRRDAPKEPSKERSEAPPKDEGTRKEPPPALPDSDVGTKREEGTRKESPLPSGGASTPDSSPKQSPTSDIFRSFEAQDAALELAREGRVLEDRRLGKDSANETRRRELAFGGQHGVYIYKPSYGEEVDLRTGIQAGTYHQREAAAYNVDRLFGEGTVVPPTLSNGEGSYQAWSEGGETLRDEGASLESMSTEDLKAHPDFQRINLLDVILAHEDRHSSNLMFRWVGPKDDLKNLRFDAIDNGLTLADPLEKQEPEDYVLRSPWGATTDSYNYEEIEERNAAVEDVLENIPPELHEKVKNVKLEDFVKALTESGLNEGGAIQAAAIRFVAIQEDPEILKKFMSSHERDDRDGGIKEFLLFSGSLPRKLLRLAGAEGRFDEIKRTVREATKLRLQ